MELLKLEKYKSQFRHFDSSINKLQSYLKGLDNGAKFALTPYFISKILNTSELDAIFLLSLAERENILQRKFRVVTNEGSDLLDEFDHPEDIPDKIVDKATGQSIDHENFHVDLVFEAQ